jgi:transcriptional regulator
MPVATHIPLLLEEDAQGRDVLLGHIARGNAQKETFGDGTRVLAIFPGPHAYVSPRWYANMNVPTWNYMAVHVYGTLTVIAGEELKAALSRLVDNYEQHLPKPVQLGEMGEERVAAEMRGIVGFRILVEEIQAAYKLSQNRDEKSYREVIRQLEDGDGVSKAVAAEMRERESGLFSTEKESGKK